MLRRLFLVLGIAVLLGAGLFAAGPRTEAETTRAALDLPDDLDAYLADREGRFDDLRPGTEKAIVWADPDRRQRTPVSIVYVHGFTSTRGETHPLSDTLAARLGANLFYTRLTGHGRGPDALGEATVTDWFADVREAYAVGQRLGERVVLVGTSMGGALSTWLAAQPEADSLMTLLLISPAYGLRDVEGQRLLTRLADLPWGERIVQMVVGEYFGEANENPEQEHFWTSRYRSDALVALAKILGEVEQLDFSNIEAPVFIAYAPEDRVISPARIEARFPSFGARYKDTLQVRDSSDPYQHVIAGDILSPETTAPIAEAMLQFLQPLLR